MEKKLVVSRLDGEEIAPARPSPWAARPSRPSHACLGRIDGAPAMAEHSVAARIESYEALARAKKLADKPWLSLDGLLRWLEEPDGAPIGSFCEASRPDERGDA